MSIPYSNALLAKERIRSFTEAVQLLHAGALVIYPTETFFALGCKMSDVKALESVYSTKQRPSKRPLPLLAAHMAQVDAIAHVTDAERALMYDFWPSSLTLICKARANVSPFITAGTGKVAVRISPHAVATSLTEAVGEPLVCSSANISGEAPVVMHTALSSLLLLHVQGLIIEGTLPQGGLPSTLAEVNEEGLLHIRRHGAVSQEDLQKRGWQMCMG